MSITDNNLDTNFPNNGATKQFAVRDDADILQYLNNCYSICKNNRQQFEKKWYMNLAFFCGRQYVQWLVSGPLTRLNEPAAPKWRVRLVTNHIRRYVRKEMAKLNQESPVGFVIPASNDDEDLLAARAGDAIIEHEWREKNVNLEFSRASFWQAVCGNGFLKDYWNVNGGPVGKDRKTKAGTFALEPISPFHLFIPDITIEEIERQPYVIHESAKDRSWVQKTFKVELPDSPTNTSAPIEEMFLQAMGIQNAGGKKGSVFVKEIWIKPGGRYPKGAYALWTGDTLLEFKEEWPVPYEEYPFTKLDNIPTGCFYTESAVTDCIPLQKEYNRSRSQIVESKNLMAAPQLAAQRGSMDANKYTSQPGLIVFYKAGYQPPTALQKGEMPSYAIQDPEKIKSDMDDIFSQHEVSRGQTPPGIEAATAISYLQEQDDTSIQSAIKSIELGAEKVGRHILIFANAYWDDNRKIITVGLNNQMEAYEFSKTDIRDNTSYVVQAGSATPRSTAAKRAFIESMMDKGYIPPERGLRYLEMSEISKLYEEMQIDTRHAQRENIKMRNGLETTINTWDNHQAHIFEHDQFRKRQEYDTLDPEFRMFFEQHITYHKLYFCGLMGYDLNSIAFVPQVDPETGQETMMLNPDAQPMIESVYYRLSNGIPIQQPGMDPNAVDSGAGQETQQGIEQPVG